MPLYADVYESANAIARAIQHRNKPWPSRQIPGRRRGLALDGTSPGCFVGDGENRVHAEEARNVALTRSRRASVLDPPQYRGLGHQLPTDYSVASLA